MQITIKPNLPVEYISTHSEFYQSTVNQGIMIAETETDRTIAIPTPTSTILIQYPANLDSDDDGSDPEVTTELQGLFIPSELDQRHWFKDNYLSPVTLSFASPDYVSTKSFIKLYGHEFGHRRLFFYADEEIVQIVIIMDGTAFVTTIPSIVALPRFLTV